LEKAFLTLEPKRDKLFCELMDNARLALDALRLCRILVFKLSSWKEMVGGSTARWLIDSNRPVEAHGLGVCDDVTLMALLTIRKLEVIVRRAIVATDAGGSFSLIAFSGSISWQCSSGTISGGFGCAMADMSLFFGLGGFLSFVSLSPLYDESSVLWQLN
jgi:hypothetical protein